MHAAPDAPKYLTTLFPLHSATSPRASAPPLTAHVAASTVTAPLNLLSILNSVVELLPAKVSDRAAAPAPASVLPALTVPFRVESPTPLIVLGLVLAPVTALMADRPAAPAAASKPPAVTAPLSNESPTTLRVFNTVIAPLTPSVSGSHSAPATAGESTPEVSHQRSSTFSPLVLHPLPSRAAPHLGAYPTTSRTSLLSVRYPLGTPVLRTLSWLPRGITVLLCCSRPAATTLLAPLARLSPGPLAVS